MLAAVSGACFVSWCWNILHLSAAAWLNCGKYKAKAQSTVNYLKPQSPICMLYTGYFSPSTHPVSLCTGRFCYHTHSSISHTMSYYSLHVQKIYQLLRFTDLLLNVPQIYTFAYTLVGNLDVLQTCILLCFWIEFLYVCNGSNSS